MTNKQTGQTECNALMEETSALASADDVKPADYVYGIADLDVLIEAAWQARELAYAPYSGFTVGAAVQGASGTIYQGCNIENVSYGLTNCAERTAMFTAIANGERHLVRMAVCADTPEPVAPCGACRQVMQELGPEMEIVLVNRQGKRIITTVPELLPYQFQIASQQKTR